MQRVNERKTKQTFTRFECCTSKKLTDILTDLISSLLARSEILREDVEESSLFKVHV